MKRRKHGTSEVSEMPFGCMNASGNGHQEWLDGLVAAARKGRS
jgi:hypothetical protein